LHKSTIDIITGVSIMTHKNIIA